MLVFNWAFAILRALCGYLLIRASINRKDREDSQRAERKREQKTVSYVVKNSMILPTNVGNIHAAASTNSAIHRED